MKNETVVKQVFKISQESDIEIPLVNQRVPAGTGFPSPATDYSEKRLDLNQKFIKHPAATFAMQVDGDSMIDAGIFPDDFLLVDRAVMPKIGSIVVAEIDGAMLLKRIEKKGKKYFLTSENSNYKPIEVHEMSELNIWGVVTYNIHGLL